MALITYADKQAMGTQPSIPDVNKVMDSDLNQIKIGINNSTTYSTSEIVIGEWLGKPLYRKVINFGSLPNNTAKNVAHGISNIGVVVRLGGYAVTSGTYFPLPLQYRGADSNYNVDLVCTAENVRMTSNTDRTSYTAYVILEYTKTTD